MNGEYNYQPLMEYQKQAIQKKFQKEYEYRLNTYIYIISFVFIIGIDVCIAIFN
jgi:hypothetical protein